MVYNLCINTIRQMKEVIQINYNIIILSDYQGNYKESQIKNIAEILKTTNAKNGDLYEYDENFVDNQKIVGEWSCIDVQEDLDDLEYSELKEYFLDNFNLNLLFCDLLEIIEEQDEDKARNFMIKQFLNAKSRKEIAKILYQID